VSELVAARFVTGCGIGGVVPAMAAFAAELTPLRSRNFSVTLVQAATRSAPRSPAWWRAG